MESLKVKCEMTRETLINVARTSLRTKLTQQTADILTESIVDAVLAIKKPNEALDLHMVEIMQMQHKTDTETKFTSIVFVLKWSDCLIVFRLVKGIVMDHGARHPDMKKSVTDAFILTCNVSLEYEKRSA
jgi:T-complex protein 1 subunit zeta